MSDEITNTSLPSGAAVNAAKISAHPAIPEYWLPSEPHGTNAAVKLDAGFPHPRRILIAKPGLDGHDRGAKYVAQVLRDAGFEVFYTGIRRTPRQIVAAGILHEVDAIGLSLLSGAHNFLFAELFRELAARGASDIHVFGGGVVPEDDVDHLLSLGVKALFTPGTPATEIVAAFRHVFHDAETR